MFFAIFKSESVIKNYLKLFWLIIKKSSKKGKLHDWIGNIFFERFVCVRKKCRFFGMQSIRGNGSQFKNFSLECYNFEDFFGTHLESSTAILQKIFRIFYRRSVYLMMQLSFSYSFCILIWILAFNPIVKNSNTVVLPSEMD